MSKKPIVIRNPDDLAAAIARADELTGCANDSDEERELEEIINAIEVYDEMTRVLRLMGAREHGQAKDDDERRRNPKGTDPFKSDRSA